MALLGLRRSLLFGVVILAAGCGHDTLTSGQSSPPTRLAPVNGASHSVVGDDGSVWTELSEDQQDAVPISDFFQVSYCVGHVWQYVGLLHRHEYRRISDPAKSDVLAAICLPIASTIGFGFHLRIHLRNRDGS